MICCPSIPKLLSIRCFSERISRFMAEALAEAAKGLGRTSPNPAVGAVMVQGDA